MICPNIHLVEVTCVAFEVTVLQWQRNGADIGGGFTAVSVMGDIQPVEPFTLILDSITTRTPFSNMTSRLMANISNLISGDRIECAAVVMQDAITLNYTLRGKLYKFNHQPLYLH